MIYDTLRHIDSYQGIHPRVMRGLELLRDTDFAQLPDGAYEVEGKDLFYFLQSYETKPQNDTPEAHKLYADIMLMLSGQEQIGVAPLETCVDANIDATGDIRFYKGELTPVVIRDDHFVVFFPGDAHAPGVSPDGVPRKVRKCVVKVKL